jgi:hypothetical protein
MQSLQDILPVALTPPHAHGTALKRSVSALLGVSGVIGVLGAFPILAAVAAIKARQRVHAVASASAKSLTPFDDARRLSLPVRAL